MYTTPSITNVHTVTLCIPPYIMYIISTVYPITNILTTILLPVYTPPPYHQCTHHSLLLIYRHPPYWQCEHHHPITNVHTTTLLPMYTPPPYYQCTHHHPITNVHTTILLSMYTPPPYYQCTHYHPIINIHTTTLLSMYTPPLYYQCTHYHPITTYWTQKRYSFLVWSPIPHVLHDVACPTHLHTIPFKCYYLSHLVPVTILNDTIMGCDVMLLY